MGIVAKGSRLVCVVVMFLSCLGLLFSMQGYHIDAYDCCLKIMDQLPNDLWVDFYHTGTEPGTYLYPYNTLIEGKYSVKAIQRQTVVGRGDRDAVLSLLRQGLRLDRFH